MYSLLNGVHRTTGMVYNTIKAFGKRLRSETNHERLQQRKRLRRISVSQRQIKVTNSDPRWRRFSALVSRRYRNSHSAIVPPHLRYHITDLELRRNPIWNEGASLLARSLGNNALPNLTRPCLSTCGIYLDGLIALVLALEQNSSLFHFPVLGVSALLVFLLAVLELPARWPRYRNLFGISSPG
jgi:hypothetical protein